MVFIFIYILITQEEYNIAALFCVDDISNNNVRYEFSKNQYFIEFLEGYDKIIIIKRIVSTANQAASGDLRKKLSSADIQNNNLYGRRFNCG